MKATGVFNIVVEEEGKETYKATSPNKLMIGTMEGLIHNTLHAVIPNTHDYCMSSIVFDAKTGNNTSEEISGVESFSGCSAGWTALGTLVDATDFLPNQAMSFNGTSQAALYTFNYPYSLSNKWTQEFWVKIAGNPSSQAIMWMLGRYTGASGTWGKSIFYLNTNGTVAWNTLNSALNAQVNTLTSTTALTLNKWTHIALVKSPSLGGMLFQDGVLVAYNSTYTDYCNWTSNMLYEGLIGCGKDAGTAVVKPFTGQLNNLAVIYTDTLYQGTIVGNTYFTPSIMPKTSQQPYRGKDKASSFCPYLLVLSKDTTINRAMGTAIDSFTGRGVLTLDYVNTHVIDLTTPPVGYTVTTTRESMTSVKIKVVLPKNVALGTWSSIYIVDKCRQFNRNDITYPIISKYILPTPVIKYARATMTVEWTLTLSTT